MTFCGGRNLQVSCLRRSCEAREFAVDAGDSVADTDEVAVIAAGLVIHYSFPASD